MIDLSGINLADLRVPMHALRKTPVLPLHVIVGFTPNRICLPAVLTSGDFTP